MRPYLTLILIFGFLSCRQINSTKKLATYDLKYSAFYWHFNQQTNNFEFYLVHYVDIDREGNYVLMLHDVWRDKPKYFKGAIGDTIRECIDTTFLNDNFKTDYSYSTKPNFIYDGFTYCLDYRTQNNERKKILFIPHDSPAKINILSSLLDTLIYSSKSEILDTIYIAAYTKQLKEFAYKVDQPPPPPTKTILFKPPKIKE